MNGSQLQQYLLQNIWLVIILAIWTLPWKAFALWKSAKRNEKWWFFILLIVNTAGILEILYIFVFSKSKKRAM